VSRVRINFGTGLATIWGPVSERGTATCVIIQVETITAAAVAVVHMNSTELQLANTSVNSRIGMHVVRTTRALIDLVSLQPISTKYSRDADACDQ